MRALVIKFLVVVCIARINANVLKNIFSGLRGNPSDEHDEDCRDEQHSHFGFASTRRESFTSPGTLWRIPTSPRYDDFVDRFPSPSDPDSINKDRRREESTRHTTENWKPIEDTFGNRGSDERDVLATRQTSTPLPQRSKTASGESLGNEVERDSMEGLDGVKMRLAEKWCTRYEKKCVAKRTTRHGLSTRIVGGRRAEPKKHPHMVMIGYGAEDKKQWLCGGSLISSRFVLSAAHCSQTSKGPARWVLLGELDVSTTADDARPQEKEIVERLLHPSYQEPATYHDIALFKMDSDVAFTSWVYPACLHFTRTVPSTFGTVTGWGRTGFVSDVSKALLEVDVSIFNDSLCTRTVNKLAGAKMPRGYDPTSMICAGDIAGGKDACQGDSGGPLVITDNSCIKTQVGIVSIGSECGLPESPGVYTRVSEYVSWIEGIVWS